MIKMTYKLAHKKWSRRDTIMLLERLELYVSSGLPLNSALKLASERLKPWQVTALGRVQTDIESGGRLSQSLAVVIRLPNAITGLISHGESSGDLASTLSSAKVLLEREDELIKKCMSAMTYPVVIGIFAGGMTVALVRGIMPQILPMLISLHVPLPFLTRMVMAVSNVLIAYGLYIVLGGMIAVVVAVYSYRKFYRLKSLCHGLLIKIPLVGSLIASYYLSVFLRSCGSLTSSGLPVADSYENAVGTVALISLKSRLGRCAGDIRNGGQIGRMLCFKPIPAYVAPLLQAGEASGTLGPSMIRSADILDRDIEHSLKRMTSLIEPVMMAGMGCGVGSIALSIMMPIYDVSRVLQQH